MKLAEPDDLAERKKLNHWITQFSNGYCIIRKTPAMRIIQIKHSEHGRLSNDFTEHNTFCIEIKILKIDDLIYRKINSFLFSISFIVQKNNYK